jgi:hypothetical protein
MIVKLGKDYINLTLVPIIEFDRDDQGRERVVFWLHQGPVTYVEKVDVSATDFQKFKRIVKIWGKYIVVLK